MKSSPGSNPAIYSFESVPNVGLKSVDDSNKEIRAFRTFPRGFCFDESQTTDERSMTAVGRKNTLHGPWIALNRSELIKYTNKSVPKVY